MNIVLNPEKNISLSAYFVEPKQVSKCIIFLPGGGKTIGNERFKNWQDKLIDEEVVSVSLDFSGVGLSSGDLTKQTLEKRIKEAECVTRWIVDKYPNIPITVLGVSMGGYVALGLVEKLENVFNKVILQVPAAYSRKAHNLNFDDNFTKELRTLNSWNDSYSFYWWKNFKGKKLLIANERDEVIPYDIIERYRRIGEDGSNFSLATILGASHNVFGDKRLSDETYEIIKNFLVEEL